MSEKDQIVHVTDMQGREYIGALRGSVEGTPQGARWVKLSPAFAYIVEPVQGPQGQVGLRRSAAPVYMLEGVEQLELLVQGIAYLRPDNTDYPSLSKEAEKFAAGIRAQASGIEVAGPGRIRT